MSHRAQQTNNILRIILIPLAKIHIFYITAKEKQGLLRIYIEVDLEGGIALVLQHLLLGKR